MYSQSKLYEIGDCISLGLRCRTGSEWPGVGRSQQEYEQEEGEEDIIGIQLVSELH